MKYERTAGKRIEDTLISKTYLPLYESHNNSIEQIDRSESLTQDRRVHHRKKQSIFYKQAMQLHIRDPVIPAHFILNDRHRKSVRKKRALTCRPAVKVFWYLILWSSDDGKVQNSIDILVQEKTTEKEWYRAKTCWWTRVVGLRD
jgi:hypothetical protein